MSSEIEPLALHVVEPEPQTKILGQNSVFLGAQRNFAVAVYHLSDKRIIFFQPQNLLIQCIVFFVRFSEIGNRLVLNLGKGFFDPLRQISIRAVVAHL